MENGVLFTGTGATRISRIMSATDIIAELVEGATKSLSYQNVDSQKGEMCLRFSLFLTQAVILALLFTGCSAKVPSEPLKTQEELEEIAKDFVISMSQGKWEDACSLFDKKMEKAISASELKKLWTDLLSQQANGKR